MAPHERGPRVGSTHASACVREGLLEVLCWRVYHFLFFECVAGMRMGVGVSGVSCRRAFYRYFAGVCFI